ncbi:MAG: GSCFA domain-containing protein [Rhizomicrobium sp.]
MSKGGHHPGRGFERGGFEVELTGRRQRVNWSWYRGPDCNFSPTTDDISKAQSVVRYVVGSWAPQEPLIGPDTRICAFGSCFARNISEWLASRRFTVLTKPNPSSSSYVVRFGEGLVNSYSLLQQFEWAFENKKDEVLLWHDYDTREQDYDESVRLETLELFRQTDVFILTLGLSEVWYDSATGGVFWRAIPADKFDPARHGFRVTTVDENRANLQKIYELIRKYRPQARIIFTMSPIPLVATFRPVPCITANSASKAILRAALDQFLRDVRDDGGVYYWPSYEIVLDIFTNCWKSDRRHVRPEVLAFVMTAFEHVWCFGSKPKFTMAEAWIRARAATGSLPANLPALFSERATARLADIVARLRKAKRSGDVDLLLERASEIALVIPEPATGATARGARGVPTPELPITSKIVGLMHRLIDRSKRRTRPNQLPGQSNFSPSPLSVKNPEAVDFESKAAGRR